MTYTVSIPGAFETFFSGTGVVAGDSYSDDPAEEAAAAELREAWKTSTRIRRGKGHSDRVELRSIRAVLILAMYAETCLISNFGGDKDYAEIAGARKVLERVEQATEGRVKYDGWNVTLDGERWT